MIVVTGAAGFIGSCMVSKLNKLGRNYNIKKSNYSNLQFAKKIDRKEFISWFEKNASKIDGVYHLGARTDTTEFDWKIFLDLNLNYSKNIWRICAFNSIPLVYASSAATY